MVILAYGIEQPTTGDRGSIFFPALEHLCQRMASHNHNNINSTPIVGGSVTIGSALAPAVNWALVSTGLYSQLVNLPVGYSYDNGLIEVRREDTKEHVFAKVTRVSGTQVTIFAATNTLDYRVYIK